MRVANLMRLSDQIERLLRDKGSPMHIGELETELRKATPHLGRSRTVRHISSCLWDHKERFKPIGRSGYWIINDWTGHETRTIPEVSVELLRGAKRPLNEAELYGLIVARRPVASPGSIGRALAEDRRFHRVGPRLWALNEIASRRGIR